MNFMLVEITKLKEGEFLTVTSRDVAEDFGKRHDNVVRDIENLILGLGSPQNSAGLFVESSYVHEQNKQMYKQYFLTRDGFSLLVMGFTGADALQWKLKYIKAFNTMEKELKRLYAERQKWEIERQKGVLVRHILTDTIKMKVADSPHKKFAYPNYTKLIYKTIFGKTMKELQTQYGVKGRESIREYVTADELKQIESMEMLVSSLISCGWGYDQIKDFVQTNATKMLAG